MITAVAMILAGLGAYVAMELANGRGETLPRRAATIRDNAIKVLRGPIRPFLAWIVAEIVGFASMLLAVTATIASAVYGLPAGPMSDRQIGGVIEIGIYIFAAVIALAGLISLLAPLAVMFFRRGSAPRPFADIMLGGVITALSSALGHGMFGDAVYPVATFFAGALAGYVYWLLAGRPRPPYASTTANSAP